MIIKKAYIFLTIPLLGLGLIFALLATPFMAGWLAGMNLATGISQEVFKK